MAGLHIMTGTRRLCLDRRRLSYDSRGRRLTIPVDTFEIRWERRKLRVACPAGKPKKPAIGLVCFVLISGSNILPACALGSPCRHTSPDHRRSANTSSIIGLPSTSGSTPPEYRLEYDRGVLSGHRAIRGMFRGRMTDCCADRRARLLRR